MEKFRVLSVVVESEYCFDLPGPDTEPVFEVVVARGPVKRDMTAAQFAYVADIDLTADMESIENLRGYVQPSVSKRKTAFTGI